VFDRKACCSEASLRRQTLRAIYLCVLEAAPCLLPNQGAYRQDKSGTDSRPSSVRLCNARCSNPQSLECGGLLVVRRVYGSPIDQLPLKCASLTTAPNQVRIALITPLCTVYSEYGSTKLSRHNSRSNGWVTKASVLDREMIICRRPRYPSSLRYVRVTSRFPGAGWLRSLN
jgi:hypothetical protein